MEFKIGDLITGNKYNPYGVTDSSVVCEVININKHSTGEDIQVLVKMDKDTGNLWNSDSRYWVYSEYFELYHGCVNLEISSPEEIDCFLN